MYKFIYLLFVAVLISCSKSTKIVDYQNDTLILNVKSTNIHYTRALVMQFIQNHQLQILSDKKFKIEGRYRLMELEFSFSEKLMESFLISTELQSEVPTNQWDKEIKKINLKIHYIK